MLPHDPTDDPAPSDYDDLAFDADDGEFAGEDASGYDYDSIATDEDDPQTPAAQPRAAAPTRVDTFAVTLWWRLRLLIFTGAFLTPLLVLGGLLFALASFNNDEADPQRTDTIAPPTTAPLPTATYALTPQWPDIVFIPHSTPARIRNVLETASTKHGYMFEGTAGESWRIAAQAYQGSAATPIVMLFAPTGERLCQEAGCAGEPRSSVAITLPDSGTYRLVVESTSGTGLYLFTLDTN